ncbi:MAG: LLM class flavin-dependent oxidoreductase [Chloroflexi bacterium]|nr:LLM class flavin-dependent oxidoreductase [Chloroflexota bacterium]MBI4504448.1 LLM class flavin-dependent oxidoreductase [Chloroflexota bacterium]
MSLKFAVGMLSNDLDLTVAEAKLAEDLGYHLVRIADSQSLFYDCYVALAPVAIHTSRILVGTGVTNPVTRHPVITAGAISTIDDLSGGRAVLGIGTGFSAVHTIDEKPASPELLREYVIAIRELYEHRETTYRGKTIRLTWPKRRVPIWIAASGPRALRVAGELADVVIMGSGFLPECIAADLPHVAEGARAGGRRLEDLALWVFGPANIASTWEAAVEPLKAGLAGTGQFTVARDLREGQRLPAELMPALRRYVAGYRPDQHQGGAGSPNARLVDELGVTRYLAERFGLIGTPEQCVAQARAVAKVGIHGLMLTIVTPEPLQTIRDVGEKVMARV